MSCALKSRFDRDGSGYLDGRELKKMVIELLPQCTDNDIEFIWSILDLNGDEGITANEFLKVQHLAFAPHFHNCRQRF